MDTKTDNGFQEPPVSVLQRGDAEFPVNGMAFSKHAEVLATGQGEGHHGVQLWDPKTGRPLSPLQSSVEVLNMRFLPDGKTLLTFGWEQSFRLWDISTRTNIAFLRAVPGHETEIWSVALAPNGRMIASGSKDGMIKVWDIEVFQKQPEVKDRIDAQSIGDISFSQDGHTVYTVSLSSALGSWDTETLQPRAFVNLPRAFRRAAFSPQSTQLALGLTNGAFEVWRIFEPKNGPQLLRELLPAQRGAEPIPAVPLMTWSRDGKEIAAFANDLYVWNIATGQSNKLSLGVKLDSIALSPNGGTVAAASGPVIQLWEVRTGQQLSRWVGHDEEILELAFSPDGKFLASVSLDNTAALWDVPSGTLRWKSHSHTLAVPYLAFAPDGRCGWQKVHRESKSLIGRDLGASCGSMFEFLRVILIYPLSLLRPHHALAMENLALRHQIIVLKRRTQRPKLRPWDRCLWMILKRVESLVGHFHNRRVRLSRQRHSRAVRQYIFGDLALIPTPVRTNGRLFYADVQTGEMHVLKLPQFGSEILPNDETVHGFGPDAGGELYAMATDTPPNGNGERVYKLASVRLMVILDTTWNDVPNSAGINHIVVPIDLDNPNVFYLYYQKTQPRPLGGLSSIDF